MTVGGEAMKAGYRVTTHHWLENSRGAVHLYIEHWSNEIEVVVFDGALPVTKRIKNRETGGYWTDGKQPDQTQECRTLMDALSFGGAVDWRAEEVWIPR
jgi:hypothetical protein